MSFSRMSRGKSRSMSGSEVNSSLRKRPMSSSLAIGSTCESPVRKQTIEDTLEPRPPPGGSRARALPGPPPLARQLQHVVVQQKEAGQAQRVDDPHLLL